VEGFGVINDALVIEMGWVILNIVSKRLGKTDLSKNCLILAKSF